MSFFFRFVSFTRTTLKFCDLEIASSELILRLLACKFVRYIVNFSDTGLVKRLLVSFLLLFLGTGDTFIEGTGGMFVVVDKESSEVVDAVARTWEILLGDELSRVSYPFHAADSEPVGVSDSLDLKKDSSEEYVHWTSC